MTRADEGATDGLEQAAIALLDEHARPRQDLAAEYAAAFRLTMPAAGS